MFEPWTDAGPPKQTNRLGWGTWLDELAWNSVASFAGDPSCVAARV